MASVRVRPSVRAMHIFRSLLLAVLLVFATKAHGVIFNLVSPSAAVAIGSEVRLDLLVLNPGAEALSLQLPGIIKGSLCDETHCWPVELKAAAISGQVQVAPGGFSVREYRVTLPRQAAGILVLDITEPVAAKVAIKPAPDCSRERPCRLR
ncbi:MAG: hypothetical protein IPN11_11910 [Opitutaceae bacterium]|nr:hypothetical protein [Opitutaceae bacterium]